MIFVKKQTKGIIFTILFGGSLLFWATAASMPNLMSEDEPELTITNTPADNFPDEQRPQFCETGDAKSNRYVQEYKIPTACTQPLAITTDPEGNVWFAQTNTGNIAKFIPDTESFVEYENPSWPTGGRSMMWGIDYAPDGSLWYTDETYDRIWKFVIDEEQYISTTYPTSEDSLPQKIKVQGSQIVVNDLTGAKITLLDPAKTGDDIVYENIPSPIEGSLTGDFAIDSQNNIWYTNWVFQADGVLVKFDQDNEDPSINATSIYKLPLDLTTPNGLVIGPDEKIWIVDTASSFFFRFDPESAEFTKYVTSDPPMSTYGNSSGLIKTPISRPYWVEVDDSGKIVFNEQTANSIGFFDPIEESLVEYLIPSKNPNWADCTAQDDCGLAQIFGFAINDDKVWFTQWVENNIGVIDRSIPLPVSIDTDVEEIIVAKGESTEFEIMIYPETDETHDVSFVTSDTSPFSDLLIKSDAKDLQIDSQAIPVKVSITAAQSALADSHKVLLGAHADDVTVSKYITVHISE